VDEHATSFSVRWVAFLSFVFVAIVYASNANACSCRRLTPSEGFTSSYAVFTGEVVDITKNRSTRFGGLEVTLRVKNLWKGDPVPMVKVHTAGSSAACGYPFVQGTTYLVYAIRDEADPLRVSLCSRTAPVDQAKEDLDFLKKPTHTFDGRKSGCRVSAGDIDLPFFALFGIAVVLAARRLT
jgi:hypothetical protein